MKFNPLFKLADASVLIAGLAMLSMMTHVTADVVLKYTVNKPIAGTLEIVSAYYMVAVVFLPLAAVEMAREAISVDILYNWLPRRLKIVCMLLALLLSLAVYCGLFWVTLRDAMRSYEIGEVIAGTVYISVWMSRFVLPISFALALAMTSWHLMRFVFSPSARAQLLSTADQTSEEI
uniref:TRAP transporter small permease n=1 Tax=Roseovarius indicus TaxID=540747 RepID=UPI003B52927F